VEYFRLLEFYGILLDYWNILEYYGILWIIMEYYGIFLDYWIFPCTRRPH
jgi:hypothetical protein